MKSSSKQIKAKATDHLHCKNQISTKINLGNFYWTINQIWIIHSLYLVFLSFALSVGLLTLSGLVWPTGSGYVLSALANTGAWESISGKNV